MSAQSRGVEQTSWRVVEKEHNKINDKWLCVCAFVNETITSHVLFGCFDYGQ